MSFRFLLVALLLAVVPAPTALGQQPDQDAAVSARYKKAREAAKARNWDAAAAEYQALLASERAWVCVLAKSASGVYPGAAATALDDLLAQPAEAWTAWERGFGAEARALLDAAKRSGDPFRLEEVAARYPLTAAGREALPAAVDVALAQGRLGLAAAAWARHAATLAADGPAAAEARPIAVERARRLIEAVAAAGEAAGGTRLAWLRGIESALSRWPNGDPDAAALGSRIAAAIAAFDARALPPAWWPAPVPQPAPALMATLENVGEWRWGYRFPVTQELFLAKGAREPESLTDAPTPYHLAADRDRIYLVDGQAVTAFDRVEGLGGAGGPAWRHYYRLNLINDHSLRGQGEVDLGSANAYAPVLDGDAVLALVGVASDPNSASGSQTSVAGRPLLLCLDRATGKRRWVVDVDASDAASGLEGITFYSVPLAVAGRVFVLGAAKDRHSTVVACVDRADGRFLWKTAIPVRTAGIRMSPQWIHDLGVPVLAESGGRVFVNNHLGFLASLDLHTGGLRWTAACSKVQDLDWSGRRTGTPRIPDPNVVVVAGGLVIAAQPEMERIAAFRADTGAAAWACDGLPDLRHVYGVLDGRLYVSGRFATAIDLQTGKKLWDSALRDQGNGGRGSLTREGLVCPSGGRIAVLSLDGGGVVHTFSWGRSNRRVGNLLLSGGELAVATEAALHVFRLNPPALERPPTAELDRRVAELGDGEPARREAASRDLAALGALARAALERGAEDPDAEIAWRSRALLERLQRTELLVKER